MRISDWSSDVCSSDLETEDGDVLAAFLGQFYDDKPAPRLILLSHAVPEAELIAEALSTRAERKVELLVPQRGSKRKLAENEHLNAREALGRRMAERGSQRRPKGGVERVVGREATPGGREGT